MVSLTIEYTQKRYFYYSTTTIRNTEAGPVHSQHENVSIIILPSCPPEKEKISEKEKSKKNSIISRPKQKRVHSELEIVFILKSFSFRRRKCLPYLVDEYMKKKVWRREVRTIQLDQSKKQ